VTTTTTTTATTTTTMAPTTTTTQKATTTTTKKGCPAVKCANFGGEYVSACTANAGSDATCEVNAIKASPLQKNCMSASLEVTCPENNAAAGTLPFLASAPVGCKACGLSTATLTKASDKDPALGKFMVELKWGGNINSQNQFVNTFDEWEIHMVDANGVSKGVAARVPKKVAPSTCCNQNEYKKTVRGTMATGATKFMIVPHAKAVALKSAAFSLPVGVMTSAFVDWNDGSATVHTGEMTMGVSDAAGFAASPHRFQIMADAIAAAAKDITADMINVVSVNVARRLSNTRLLAAGNLKVVYEVIVPSTFSGQAFTAASIDKTALKSAVVTQAQASGMSSFAVTSLTVKAPTTTSVGTGTQVTGAASPMAGVSALIVAVVMLAGRQLLA